MPNLNLPHNSLAHAPGDSCAQCVADVNVNAHALRQIVAEAIGASAYVAEDVKHVTEHGALLRCITYTLGGTYYAGGAHSSWPTHFNAVKEVILDGANPELNMSVDDVMATLLRGLQ